MEALTFILLQPLKKNKECASGIHTKKKKMLALLQLIVQDLRHNIMRIWNGRDLTCHQQVTES